MKKETIIELHKKLLNKELLVSDIIKEAILRAKKCEHLNPIVTFLEENSLKKAKYLDKQKIAKTDYLFGIPFGCKDNLATKEILTTGSSKILANFIPMYDSSVISKLKTVNSIMIAKTTLDELGMGGTGLDAATGYVYNPWNKNHIVGGSSSGSAVLVAAGVVPFALGSDTGDSVRKPASFSGIVGFKPTYGLVSRYGLFDYAPSLDTIGVFTNNVEDCALVFDEIIGYDEKDSTSLKSEQTNFYQNLNRATNNYKLATLKLLNDNLEPDTKQLWDQTLKKIKQNGIIVEEVDFDLELLTALSPVYMIISFAEATSSQACLDGINFGIRIEDINYEKLMIKTRSKNFGSTLKKRYIIGSYALVEENQKLLFNKAKKVRKKIVNVFNEILNKYDGFIVPAAPSSAPTINNVVNYKHKVEDMNNFVNDLLVLANFAGSPSITIPMGFIDKLPIGININTAVLKDQEVLNIAACLENIIGLKNLVIGDKND